MKFIFRLIIFSILLNLATGILINTIVDVDGDKIFAGDNNIYFGNNLEYDDSFVNEYREVNLTETTNPTSVAENVADAFYQLLDKIGIGFLKKYFSAIGDGLYGFAVFIKQITGKYFDINIANDLFDSLISLITFSYMIATYMLWSGRDFFR